MSCGVKHQVDNFEQFTTDGMTNCDIHTSPLIGEVCMKPVFVNKRLMDLDAFTCWNVSFPIKALTSTISEKLKTIS